MWRRTSSPCGQDVIATSRNRLGFFSATPMSWKWIAVGSPAKNLSTLRAAGFESLRTSIVTDPVLEKSIRMRVRKGSILNYISNCTCGMLSVRRLVGSLACGRWTRLQTTRGLERAVEYLGYTCTIVATLAPFGLADLVLTWPRLHERDP